MNKRFQGIYAALVTPYTEDGAVNCREAKKQIGRAHV